MSATNNRETWEAKEEADLKNDFKEIRKEKELLMKLLQQFYIYE